MGIAVSSQRGFTLAELAVVIIIVVVLAAIAIPAYLDYRTGGRVRYGYFVVKHHGERAKTVASFSATAAALAKLPRDTEFPKAVKAHFANATAVFNTPREVTLDSTKTIKLVISQRRPESELVGQTSMYGESKSATVTVGRTMQALLVSDDDTGLLITEKTPPVQALLEDDETYWLWDARAKRGGKYKLTLTISVDSDINGMRLQRAVTTHEEEITVVVSSTAKLTEFLANNWQWLWALLVTPAIAVLWKKWHARRRSRKAA